MLGHDQNTDTTIDSRYEFTLEIEAGHLDGERFSEQLLTMQPDEQAHLVAGLLSAYKAVCEPLENVQ